MYMNFWGFTPDYFAYSQEFFKTFLSDPKNMENLKSEFFIPLRIPEAHLILAGVFGIFGAILGMLLFRHKIRKPKFYIGLPAIFILELMCVILYMKYL